MILDSILKFDSRQAIVTVCDPFSRQGNLHPSVILALFSSVVSSIDLGRDLYYFSGCFPAPGAHIQLYVVICVGNGSLFDV